MLASARVEAGASLSVEGVKLGVGYGGGTYVQRIQYEDEGESGKWTNDYEFNAGSFHQILEGEMDLDGYLEVGLNPEVEPALWGSPPGLAIGRLKLFTLPKVGLYFYLRGELELLPDDVGVEITQPTGSSLDGQSEITLEAKASGDPEIRLLAGLDLTLRDGSVECPRESKNSLVSAAVSLAEQENNPCNTDNGAASKVPDLRGASAEEVRQILGEYGFEGKPVSQGGYQTFRHPDGSKITVNWNTGRVVREAAPIYGPDGARINKGQRLGPDGSEIPRSLPHDQHPSEYFIIDDAD